MIARLGIEKQYGVEATVGTPLVLGVQLEPEPASEIEKIISPAAHKVQEGEVVLLCR